MYPSMFAVEMSNMGTEPETTKNNPSLPKRNGKGRYWSEEKRQCEIRLESIKSKTKFENIHKVWKSLKWRWIGHMLRERKEK